MAITVSGSVRANGLINGGIQKTSSTIVKEVEFNNRFEFPTKGYHRYLYVALDENKLYRWDEGKGYVPLCSEINDDATSILSTWSSIKINTEINNAVDGIECATDEDIQDLF